nr:TPA_asm: hypothetical protein [Clonorsi virus 3]
MSIAVGEIRSKVSRTLPRKVYSVVEDSCSPTVCSQKVVPAEWKVEIEANITNCEAYSAPLQKIVVSSNWPYPAYVSNHTYYLVRTTTVYYDARNLDPHIIPFAHVRFPALCNFYQHYYLFDFNGCKFYRVCDINPTFISHSYCRRAVRAV